MTDDPGTPGSGRWEINVASEFERRGDETYTALPLLDFNYGLGERLQFKYEVPWLIEHEESGTGKRSGLGNSEVGLKWRFLDGGDAGYAVSVYPQVEFNNPGSSSDERGLADRGTTWVLPLQVQRTMGEVDYNAELGRTVGDGADEWFLGLAASRPVHEQFEIAGEVVCTTSAGLHDAAVMLNVGARATLGVHTVLLISAGQEVRNDFQPNARVHVYLAIQVLL